MKRARRDIKLANYAVSGDINFPRDNALADYDSTWDNNFTACTLITVTQC